jgi:cyclic-di-GMP phosphodiesterase TipF (flagellum assembly factor)
MVTLPGRKPRGFEVLARLRSADGTLITPDRFLAVAVHDRLLPTLDRLVLARVTQLIRDTDRHRHAVNFFCNLAHPTLADSGFAAEYLGGGGDRHGVRDKLVFEIGQRELTAEMTAPLSVVNELAQVGFRFSMDRVEHLEFDLANLASRGLRYLKLGYGLVNAAERRGELAELRRRLSGLPIELIVEKIETEAQAHELEPLGIEIGQGFLFGEPRPSKRAVA